MVFFLEPRIGAGLSGYIAEIGSGLICAHLDLPNELHDNHASYVAHWLQLWRGEHNSSNREVSIM